MKHGLAGCHVVPAALRQPSSGALAQPVGAARARNVPPLRLRRGRCRHRLRQFDQQLTRVSPQPGARQLSLVGRNVVMPTSWAVSRPARPPLASKLPVGGHQIRGSHGGHSGSSSVASASSGSICISTSSVT